MTTTEPIEFEAAEVVNDLPVEQGGLRPIPDGAIAAEQVEAHSSESEDEAEAETDAHAEEARDDRGRFQRGRRAESHRAGPDDVPRIAKLSAELRELRIKDALRDGLTDANEILTRIYPKATDAERDKQRKHVEAQLSTWKPTKAAEAATPIMPAALPVSAAETFSEPEPTLDDFANAPDPYQAHVRALGRWDARKEAFEAAQKAKGEARAAAEAKQKSEFEAIGQKWNERVAAAKASDASWEAAVKPVDAQIPSQSVLAFSILLDEDGPKMLKFLAAHQELLDELILANPPVTDATIAAMRRRLHSRMQAGTIGAAAPTKVVTPSARPISPVRTVTTVPSDDDADPNDLDGHIDRRSRERSRARR